jgi:hypothetical protein
MTDDRLGAIHREIERLPERHRVVVVLCDLEGRSYEEAARHLRCPKSRLARARERLREGLARRGVVPTVRAQGSSGCRRDWSRRRSAARGCSRRIRSTRRASSRRRPSRSRKEYGRR